MKGFLLPRPMTDELVQTLQARFPEDGETFRKAIQRGIPAISLPSQVAVLSAYVNDVDPEYFYAQLVQGYGKPEDVLLCISTSGNSRNVVRAAQMAKALGMRSFALTGSRACKLDELCDVVIKVPETETFKVQELHLPAYHFLCAQLEEELFA
jgi:phosphoheptose isomerase